MEQAEIKITAAQLFCCNEIMALNAEMQLPMDMIIRFVRAIENLQAQIKGEKND